MPLITPNKELGVLKCPKCFSKYVSFSHHVRKDYNIKGELQGEVVIATEYKCWKCGEEWGI